jgi:hypothetical protein
MNFNNQIEQDFKLQEQILKNKVLLDEIENDATIMQDT